MIMVSTRGERGPYAKGIAKRAEILDVALDVIDREGYNGATVKRLADAVGLSQNGLLRYFGSKDLLFVEVLRHHSARIEVEVDPEHTDFAVDLTTRVVDAVAANISAAGMSQLLLSLVMDATDEEHAAHEFIKNRYEAFRQVSAAALRTMQERGQFPADGDPDAAAVLLVSAFDGLQMQWMLDRNVDVVGSMTYLLSSLGITEHAGVPAQAPA